MIIRSLTMKNYGPYRNPPKINFAYGEKNLTIIEGDNDLGKTTFLSAIYWCIYGGKEPYKNSSKGRCNLEAAKEIKNSKILTVEVEVVMEDNEGNNITINRKQNYNKTSTGKMRKKGEEKFEIYKNDKPLGDPLGYRKTRLPKRLQEYFLFDGERLLDWFNGDTNTVKEEIIKLSQSNLIEKTIERTETQKNNLNDDLKELNEELADLNEQRDKLILSNKQDIKDLEENKNNIKKLTKENENLNELLNPGGDSPDELFIEINNLKKDIEIFNNSLNNLNETHLKFLLYNFSYVLSYDLLKTFITRKINDDSIDDNEYIYSISSKDLNFILNRKKCMCGHDLKEDNSAFELLSKLRDNTIKIENNSIINKKIKELINESNEIISKIPKSFQNDVEQHCNEVNKIEEYLESKIESLEIKNELYNSALKAKNKENEIKSKIDGNDKLIEGFKENIKNLQNNIDEFEPEMQRIERELDLLKINIGDEKELNDKVNFCNKIIEHCEFLKDELGRKIHKSIENNVNKQFKKIYNGDGTRNKYDAVLISESFDISLRETDGEIVTSITPSSGAQLAIALSFITAINSSSAFKLPQVMDTSIGRWGNRLRNNFADSIPHLLENNQLIFLFLDSENSSEFHDKLCEYVGKEYELQFVTKDETTIVDVTKERLGEKHDK
ncbi:AAA family ATPase [Methanobrevibacter sp.]|uniref:AAA family ATPase n=1 Tax=Methanobrevibacter sp. TaxID=66852 RepID=UPI00388FA800